MMKRSRFSLPRILGLLAGLSMSLTLAQAWAQQAREQGAPELCQACHSEAVEGYLHSKHGQKGNLRGPANQGSCLACHGQGALEHAKKGGGKGVGGVIGFANPAVTADQKSAVCLSCHEGNRQLAFWDSGKHKKNEVACSNCHSLHGTPGPGSTISLTRPNPTISPYVTTARQLEYETCTSCHREIRAQLLKTSHHPIVEGKLKCASCHNPHGALSRAMVNNESVNQLCTNCHTDKRGPFMWEHPPVEENCLNCHNSHGSAHAKLLNEKVPNLCQDCHDWSRHPGTFYSGNQGWSNATPNTRLVARSCINCHNEVHGANGPAGRGKRFLR